ncbi:hypothetical protein B0O99DRAFT_674591 [Bisporella sp. PMI_857]|nr:hypothetical protein B0O99DRAFT_674591 [Bisporella sp. PMI_857]
MYEETAGRKRVVWKPTITEKLLSLLNHIEPCQDADTGSKPAFAIVAYWLHKCLTHHRACAYGDRISELPSRVLDVGNKQDRTVSLHVSGEDERGMYCALSYRRHAHTFFTTARSNIEQLRSKIPVDQLPKAFEESRMTKILLSTIEMHVLSCIPNAECQGYRVGAQLVKKLPEYCDLLNVVYRSREVKYDH